MGTSKIVKAKVAVELTRPLISIIIPTYNRAELVVRAIKSLQSQTHDHYEIIVVDDGSSDDTSHVISDFAFNLNYLRLEHSGLPAVARNAGLAIAKGDFIAFLDSDDEWLPDKLEKQIAILEHNPGIGLVSSNVYFRRNNQDTAANLYIRPNIERSGKLICSLIKDNFIITSTVIIRRSVLEKVGIFSEEPLLRAVEDFDLWLRIAAISEVCFFPEALANYWDVGNSIRTDKSRISNHQSHLRIFERLKIFLQENNIRDLELDQRIEEQVVLYQWNLFRAFKEARFYRSAFHCLMKLFWRKRNPMFAFGRELAGKLKSKFRSNADKKSYYHHSRSEIQEPQKTRLHLGCGEVYLEGYTNIDFPPSEHTVQQKHSADIFSDIRTLTFPPDSVDEIRLHHVFEHFDRPTALRLLIDWYEWLKIGGLLIIETPDFERCAKEYLRTQKNKEKMKILRHIFGSQEAEWAIHFDGWDRGKFKLYLGELGFGEISFSTDEWLKTYNITVTAQKKAPIKQHAELIRSAEYLLQLSLVADDSPSEQKMYKVWLDKLGMSREK